MITQELIAEKVSIRKGSKSGDRCEFIPITDKIGAKLYTSEELRDNCYDWQNEAFSVGLGPETFGKFEIALDNPVYDMDGDEYHYQYGYLTEIAQLVEYYKIKSVQLNNLTDGLKDIGFNFTDNHSGNMGLIGGKLVCIDFDTFDY